MPFASNAGNGCAKAASSTAVCLPWTRSSRRATSSRRLKTLGPGEIQHAFPWKDLTDEQQRFQSAKMAIHAAMVDRMDREIGRVLANLRDGRTG